MTTPAVGLLNLEQKKGGGKRSKTAYKETNTSSILAAHDWKNDGQLSACKESQISSDCQDAEILNLSTYSAPDGTKHT